MPPGVGAEIHPMRIDEACLDLAYDAPVLSFSHFLPRRDLMRRTPEEVARLGPPPADATPEFNCSRVAGCRGLEEQIRRIGSSVHVYGHQHRNRWREVDGILYVSNCLGYPHREHLPGTAAAARLWQVWGSAADRQDTPASRVSPASTGHRRRPAGPAR